MSNSDISISILIPVYNVEDYVEESVDSILSQIDTRANLILMNDASTDNSLAVINRYQSHPQVQIVNAPHNRGLSGTRNAMMKIADTDYIWFIDSDDVMYEGAYAAVMSHIEQFGTDIVCADYVSLRVDGGNKQEVRKKAFVGTANKRYENINNSFIDNVIKNNSNHVWNKVFRYGVIADIDFKEGVNFEDIYYMTDVSAKQFSYSYLKQPVIKYRLREGSIVKTLNQKYVDDYLGAFIYRVENYPKSNKSKDGYGYLLYKVYKRYLALLLQFKKGNQKGLFLYTYETYNDIFSKFYDNCIDDISWYRKKVLTFKKIKSSEWIIEFIQ